MTIQYINIGGYANDGTGDDLRSAFEKVNANFLELGSGEVHDGANLGTDPQKAAGGIFAQRNNDAKLEFKSLISTDNSVVLTPSSSTINLKAKTKVVEDTTPLLGGNLNLNGRNVTGYGDVQSTVWGINVINLNSLVSIMLENNVLNIDLGTFAAPAGYPGVNNRGYDLEMGSFLIPGGPTGGTNQFNFGKLA